MIVNYTSPYGSLKISGNSEYVNQILFGDEEITNASDSSDSLAVSDCIRQLEEYFEGKRRQFDFPMQQSGTDFQQRVWNELINIPYGETISYLELSRRTGNTKAIRACGAANGRNKLAIVVPCHRVIGNNGKLIGYAGGLERKKSLLLHEAKLSIPMGKLF